MIQETLDISKLNLIEFQLHHSKNIYICKIFCYESGIFRIQIDNLDDTIRYKNKTNIGENLILKEFNRILVSDESITLINEEKFYFKLNHKKSNENEERKKIFKLIVYFKSFRIEYLIDDKLVSSINENSFFSLQNLDTIKPNSFDIKIYDSKHIYGLPERLVKLSLEDTDDVNSYRLYNLDVFDQVVGSFQSLYGSIPMIHTVQTDGEYMFTLMLNNSSEIWVDIKTHIEKKLLCENQYNKDIFWTTEGGIIDLFLHSDYDMEVNLHKVSLITGFSPLPSIVALGYHQCRWGYLTQEDIEKVDEGFNHFEIPYDVLWLDIDVLYLKLFFSTLTIKNTLLGILKNFPICLNSLRKWQKIIKALLLSLILTSRQKKIMKLQIFYLKKVIK